MAKKLKIAICYDFDGTLAPGNMQEHNFIPDLEMTKDNFWEEVKRYQKDFQCDEILAYMYLMLKKAKEKEITLHKDQFIQYGAKLQVFPGVGDWFESIKHHANKLYDVDVEHYILSAGIKSMIEGTSFFPKLDRVFASDFIYDDKDEPYWPSFSVNFTSKTQFLFRIEKGIFEEERSRELNDAQYKDKIYIPFDRMIYIGDGITDVPCMKLVKDRGGYSIAVYDSSKQKCIDDAIKLFKDKRVHFIAPTDYTTGSKLWKYVDYTLNKISLEGLMEDKQKTCIKM